MIRPLECFIGLRYWGSGRGRGPVSFMSAASLAGIALGVAALIVVLSVMNGLEKEQRNLLLAMADQITVKPGSDAAVVDWEALAGSLRSAAGVVSVEPYVRIEAMLRSGRAMEPVVVRGIDTASVDADSDLLRIVGADRLGRLRPGTQSIMLGRTIAGMLGVDIGSEVRLILARPRPGLPEFEQRAFTVVDVFNAGIEEHNSNLALTHLSDASRIAGFSDGPEGLALKLAEPMQAASVQQRLEQSIAGELEWSNWVLDNRSLFQQMVVEKTMITIVLMFIVAVAAFNVVTSMMMLVTEKENDIAILRTLGLAPNRVARVFLVQGALIGVIGAGVGLSIGLLVAINIEAILGVLERTFGFQVMPGDVYYVTGLPSDIRLGDLILISSFALVIALVATVVPSRRAARVEPAEVLRYE